VGQGLGGIYCLGCGMKGMLKDTRLRRDIDELISNNLFTVLLDASREENKVSGRKLRQDEVMGNMCIMLFAGHETTANTLHYAIFLLALDRTF